MKVKDIVEALEQFAPLSIQEGWDNSGLCIGAPGEEVHGVLVGFDCTPELIDEAVEKGCDMVVTHHPLIFHGLKRIQGGDPVSDAVIKAVRAGVARVARERLFRLEGLDVLLVEEVVALGVAGLLN